MPAILLRRPRLLRLRLRRLLRIHAQQDAQPLLGQGVDGAFAGEVDSASGDRAEVPAAGSDSEAGDAGEEAGSVEIREKGRDSAAETRAGE